MITGRLLLFFLATTSLSGLAFVAGCSSKDPSGGGAPSAPAETGPPTSEDGAIEDSSVPDLSDADAAEASACDGGICKTTELTATFGANTRPLDRAQFGTYEFDGGIELHIEAHAGGSPQCPSDESPTPDRTLVLTGVPRGAQGKTLKESDGIVAAFLDFKNDLGLPPLVKATAVEVKVVGEGGSGAQAWIAADVKATFEDGAVAGRFYAEHCASLSE